MLLTRQRSTSAMGLRFTFPGSSCAGGAAYLLYMSRSLAGSCAAVSSLLWLVALRYGAFQRKSQRLFQDALADTGQVSICN